MDKQQETEIQPQQKKSKKGSKESVTLPAASATLLEGSELKTTLKITFEGEVAQKILKCESELRDRLSKPDMGKILGNEILTWTEKRWSEMIEENTDIEYFFAQIRKCPDKSKSIKQLKALSEQLKSENSPPLEEAEGASSQGLSMAPPEELHSNAV